MDHYSTRQLMNHHVYFSHINKVTQYARPTMNQNLISNVYPISITDSNGFYPSKSNYIEERAVDATFPLNTLNNNNNLNGLTNPSDSSVIWQKNKIINKISPSSSSSNTSNNQLKTNGIKNETYFNGNLTRFTKDPSQLNGRLLTTTIQKGDKGLGFTLIGNDGNNSELEFIQVII